MSVSAAARSLVCALALAACDGNEATCGPTEGVVARVVDGDTIELESGERVRYLLVDAPETAGEVECYGPEAKMFNTMMVAGQAISLTYDELACTDRFDRLLAYVKVGSTDVNAELVSRGYACVLYIAPAGESRRADFDRWEAEAKARDLGLWSTCPTRPC